MNDVYDKAHWEDIQPIFIVGRGHSASTILYKMLALHPDLAWFSQYSQRDGAIPDRPYFPFYPTVNRLLRTLFTHDWRKRNRIWDSVIPNPSEADKTWNHILLEARHDLEETQLIERLRDVVCKEARQWHRNKMIFKKPKISAEIELLDKAFPSALFVHIVRDGRAHVLSIINKDRFTRKYGGYSQALLSQVAERWKGVVTKLGHWGEGRENYVEIRYEDFCDDVHGYIGRILDLAGLEKGSMPWHRLPSRLTPTNDKWFKDCPEQVMMLLDDILGDTLSQFGYEPWGG